MLKISIVESRKRRRLVVEGKLVAPWTTELTKACETAKADLHDRELVVEERDITVIDQEGEKVLLALMNDGIRLRGRGLFTKQVLKELVRRVRRSTQRSKQ